MVNKKSNSGQILPLFFVCIVILCMFWFLLINMGKLVKDRMILQNAADNAALSIAILKARALNTIGLINMTLGVPSAGLGANIFGVTSVWVPDVSPGAMKDTIEGLIETQESINKAYGGFSRIYFAKNFAIKQELDSNGNGVAVDEAICLEGYSLNLERDKGEIWYWGTLNTPFGTVMLPPGLGGIKVRDAKRWYMEGDDYYKQKVTVVVRKKAGSVSNKGFPFGGKLLGIDKWFDMEAIASAAPYNTKGTMFPRKNDKSFAVALREYYQAYQGGWEAHLVPAGFLSNH